MNHDLDGLKVNKQTSSLSKNSAQNEKGAKTRKKQLKINIENKQKMGKFLQQVEDNK